MNNLLINIVRKLQAKISMMVKGQTVVRLNTTVENYPEKRWPGLSNKRTHVILFDTAAEKGQKGEVTFFVLCNKLFFLVSFDECMILYCNIANLISFVALIGKLFLSSWWK